MKRLWWNFRYALCMYRDFPGMGFWFAWSSAVASDDAYTEGKTPAEAVWIEVSYWY